ncbi:MAG: hypothetical protein P8017_04600 [Deltaproteobacteria bacterium]
MEKKRLLTAAFSLVLLFSTVVGTQFVEVGIANPLPDINPLITIENPQNATYNVNSVTINFTVESNWSVYPCFYSLDGQNIEPVENMAVFSEELLYTSFPVSRTVLNGSCVLSHLPDGQHNVTFYLITDHEISGLPKKYEEGEILLSATNEFFIDTPQFPATFVIITSGLTTAFAGIVLLTYFKKRKRVGG